jgi:hypothetical protein
MSHLPTAQIAVLSGITKRQVQRLLVSGEIPGAERTPGGHWRVPDTKELRRWAKNFQRWNGKPVKLPERRKPAKVPRVLVVAGKDTGSTVKAAQDAVDAARKAIARADAASMVAGAMLIEESERRYGRKWWEYLAGIGLHPADAKRLMNLARGGPQGMDTPRLHKLGVADKREAKATRRPIGGQWIRQAGAIHGWFSKTTKDRPLKKWTAEEKESARSILEPLAEIHRKLV